ncbi:MAG: bifunctional DNA-formamidopyrimidine glycosylase/DNA-(apurinic or apyrimidinic site) lyase [Candidatus Niyogibacteria bacterium]|nr:bifunctional DNA-formamidopyrimidine glycosylase/DNA-(apurinic or apyrimidinic site) lyase [Candidatus Niyogibacteria bacterium]
MPELPEVETIKKDLSLKILRKKIRRTAVFDRVIVKTSLKDFAKYLRGNTFMDIERIGKLLIFSLKEGGRVLLAHLGMTGQLVYVRAGVAPGKFTRVVIYFMDGSALFFNDIRKFGYLKLAREKDKNAIIAKSFGLDALSSHFTANKLKEFLRRKKGSSLKAALLDQKLLAGIGNIYADEICFDAGFLPSRKAGSLSLAEIRRMYRSIKKVLADAVKNRGTSFRNYVDANGKSGNFSRQLKVYGREGSLCVKCGRTLIRKIILAGRGTRYCPHCQK